MELTNVCTNCGYEGDTLSISGKTSDMCVATFGVVVGHGYVPRGLNIDTYGDYIDIDICIKCGCIQEWKSRTPDQIIEAINGM